MYWPRLRGAPQVLCGGGIALWWSVCDSKTWPCGAGYLECPEAGAWSASVLVGWSSGALECCCSGVLLLWSAVGLDC
jgi:hypothetical protein